MKIESGANAAKISRNNYAAILGTIYQQGPVSRLDIAGQLHVTLPTVTTTVKQLIKDGIVREVPAHDSGPIIGRKTMAVDIEAQRYYAVGVEWGPFGLVCCITDLRGNVVTKRWCRQSEKSFVYEELLAQTAALVPELIRFAGLNYEDMVGVGWTSPGMVESTTGLMVRSSMQKVGWANKPIKTDLERLLSLPVCVENHIKTRAIGQDLFQPACRPEVYLYYFVQAGISCCVMSEGEPFGRDRYGTGDIGHTIAELGGPDCICGKKGCLQALAGEMALLESAKRLLRQGQAPVLCEICADQPELTVELLVQAIDQGDEDIRRIACKAVRYLAISIDHYVNLLNAPLVVIDCVLLNSRVLRDYLDGFISEHNIFAHDLQVKTDYIRANRFTGAKGACALAIKNFYFIRKN